MRPFTSLPRPVLLKLAILFATATIAYSVIWMYAVHHPFAVGGFIGKYSEAHRAMDVLSVELGSTAEKAGLRVGDRIVAINGRPMDNLVPYYDAVILGKVGNVVQFTVERQGVDGRLTLREALQTLRFKSQDLLTAPQLLAGQILGFYPLLFLVVGLTVLFLRPQDPNAWLLALMFGGFIAGAPLNEPEIRPSLRGFAVFYKAVMSGLSPAVFYYFFAVFPIHSPIDRRLPWLKSAWSAIAVPVGVPLGLWCLLAGGSSPLYVVLPVVDKWHVGWLLAVYFFGLYWLGLVSLVWNSVRPASVEARRKTRVIVWGTAAGFLPMLLLSAASIFLHKAPYDFPFWAYVFAGMSLFLLPLSFAYAVVKHRVMEIPVLLKRSARYVLVRRGLLFLIIVLAFCANALFTHSFSRFFPGLNSDVAMGVRLGFLAMLGWVSTPVVRRTTKRIDRAFFRSAYDARQILENLAQKIRTATGRDALAALLKSEIGEAIHPVSIAVYFESRDGRLCAENDGRAPGLEPLSPELPLLQELARRGQPLDAAPPQADGGTVAPSAFGPIEPECLVPMLGRDGRLVGLVALGSRLSEESYARDDKRLLASVASQAGVALENIRLAEQIVERMEAERRATQERLEAERRAAHEMDIAKQVQARLFPQKLPPLRTLEYAGRCIQARQVGGDYYDFLDLGPGRMGVVLADIAGKGISGALLMANLQANLRSQYAVALDDLGRLLESVNRLFRENTADHNYATLFFGDYEDSTRRLRYSNCGHNPPYVVRSDGRVERLTATATVLGLFEDWKCSISEVAFAPGDLLVIYTDGVTEATSDQGEEFGEARLLQTIQAGRNAPANGLLNSIVEAVQRFSGSLQEDDITLVVACAR